MNFKRVFTWNISALGKRFRSNVPFNIHNAGFFFQPRLNKWQSGKTKMFVLSQIQPYEFV